MRFKLHTSTMIKTISYSLASVLSFQSALLLPPHLSLSWLKIYLTGLCLAEVLGVGDGKMIASALFTTNVWKCLPVGKRKHSQLFFCTRNYHIRINMLWRLGMCFEVSYELINLGHQTNQHKRVTWEITAITQTAENRSALWMFLLSSQALNRMA